MVTARPAMNDHGNRPFPHGGPIGHQPGAFDIEIQRGVAKFGVQTGRPPELGRWAVVQSAED